FVLPPICARPSSSLFPSTTLFRSTFFDIVEMVGAPTTVMLLSVLLAVYTMGVARNIPMKTLMESAESSVHTIGMMLLILGAGGADRKSTRLNSSHVSTSYAVFCSQ